MTTAHREMRNARRFRKESVGTRPGGCSMVTSAHPTVFVKVAIVAAAIVFSIAILAADQFFGPLIRLQVLFIFPVAFAAWFSGASSGIVLAVTLPAMRLIIEHDLPTTIPGTDAIINSAIHVSTLSVFSVLVHHINAQRRRIRILQGFLPICSVCKKIRTTQNRWIQMEHYITDNSEAEFSHGLCPECAEKHYGFHQP